MVLHSLFQGEEVRHVLWRPLETGVYHSTQEVGAALEKVPEGKQVDLRGQLGHRQGAVRVFVLRLE